MTETLTLIIAQHYAGPATDSQFGAEALQIGSVVIHDTDVIAHRVAKADVAPGDHDRLAITDERRVLLQDRAVESPGLTLGKTRGELHPPAWHVSGNPLLLDLRRQDQIRKPGAWNPLRDRGLRNFRRRCRRPFVRGPASN